MGDLNESKPKAIQELQIFLDICVAKSICDSIDNRRESLVKDIYSFYEFIMNQFLENENKKFNFIYDDVVATSDIEGLYLERNGSIINISEMALPLALDQYLNTTSYSDPKSFLLRDHKGVYDLEYVDRYFKISSSYKRGLKISNIRKRHDLCDLNYHFDSFSLMIDDIYSLIKDNDCNNSKLLLDFKMPNGQFLYDYFEKVYKDIFKVFIQHKSASGICKDFNDIVENGFLWSELCNLAVLISDKCGQSFKNKISGISNQLLSKSLLSIKIMHTLEAQALNESSTRDHGNDYDLASLLNLDHHLDEIDRITWYWITSHAKSINAPNTIIYRNMLKNRNWLNETCRYVKSNWSILFEYSIYNTFSFYDLITDEAQSDMAIMDNFSMIKADHNAKVSDYGLFINNLNIFTLVDGELLSNPEISKLQSISSNISSLREHFNDRYSININDVQYVIVFE